MDKHNRASLIQSIDEPDSIIARSQCGKATQSAHSRPKFSWAISAFAVAIGRRERVAMSASDHGCVKTLQALVGAQ
jgi:hypothetical protein